MDESKLVGSEKQIEWATTIIQGLRARYPQVTLPDIPHAGFWINNRNKPVEDILNHPTVQKKAERQQQNAYLKDHGYHWREVWRVVEFYDGDEEEKVWQLFGPAGEEVSVEEALQRIEAGKVSITQAPLPTTSHSSCEWARRVVAHNPLILDTETTGFGPEAELIEVALVDLAGNEVLNLLVQCQGEIQPGAFETHGITRAMLTEALTFPDLWPILYEFLTTAEIVIYNVQFDLGVLKNTADRYGIVLPYTQMQVHCLMRQYSAFVGERRNGYRDCTYQKLSRACQQFGIDEGGHRALSDAQAARQVLLALAKRA